MDSRALSRYTNARRDATNVIVAALSVDHLTTNGVLPWAKNTPKNQRLDLLRGYINELAGQFIKDEDHDENRTRQLAGAAPIAGR